MISPLEMRVLDRNAQYFGISTLDLMEAAGKAVAEVARSEFGAVGKRVLVLCGTGNNGGDGLVAARHLSKEARVTVLLARSPDQFDTKEAQTNFERLRDVQILAGLDRSEEAIAEADLLIDALLGIGAEGSLREPFASLVRQVNGSGKPIVSVDVPSGFGTALMVRPTVTVALHDVKEGMTPDNGGRIRIVDIGIPSKVTTMIGPGEFLLYPVPRATSHKGENGRLLVIAGGPYTGAPALVGFGSLGIGIDLVHIATPASAATVVASYSPTFIVHPLVGHRLLREDLRQIIELTPRVDAVAIGPGLGDASGTLEAIREAVRGIPLPRVPAPQWQGSAQRPRGTRGNGPGNGEGPRSHDPPQGPRGHRHGRGAAQVQLHRESGDDGGRDGRCPLRPDRGAHREGDGAVRRGAARGVHERSRGRPRIRGEELWPHLRGRREPTRTGACKIPVTPDEISCPHNY